MNEKEAYELLVKYCGGEKGLIMIKEMIHVGGLDIAVKNMLLSISKQTGKVVPEDVAAWVYLSFKYVQKQMQIAVN